jgi:ribosome-binding protein aMBF1 (putative translation factor)
MSYEHQDWNQVKLRPTKQSTNKIQPSKNTILDEPIKKYNAGKNKKSETVNSAAIERKADSDDCQVLRVTHQLKMKIQQNRLNKGLSQKQLAQACNMSEATIKNYEKGIAIPNNQELQKMSKVLGVTLSLNMQ